MTANTITEMTEHVLYAAKGWFDMAALDFQAKLSSNVTIEVFAGRVCHLNASGELETGISTTKMPLFVRSGSRDLDVSNPGTTGAGGFVHKAISNTGVMNTLVATGGYELESTEFDTAPASPYAPNQLLTAKTANTTAATGGVLSNDRNGAGGSAGAVRAYTDPACGVVSRGQFTNEHGQSVLAFWSVYLPTAS